MKKFIVLTKSDWSFIVAAVNRKEAEMYGRRLCRDNKEKFVTVRISK